MGLAVSSFSMRRQESASLSEPRPPRPVTYKIEVGLGPLSNPFAGCQTTAPVHPDGTYSVNVEGITAGTLYQKRFCSHIDWRAGNLIQFIAVTVFFGVGAPRRWRSAAIASVLSPFATRSRNSVVFARKASSDSGVTWGSTSRPRR